MKLRELVETSNVVEFYGNADTEITQVCANSRDVENGAAFVAIKGFQTDGHKYIDDAVKKGASAIITEDYVGVDIPQVVCKNTRKSLAYAGAKFFGEPAKNFKLIGVTGTNGKTTTTYLVKSVLEFKGYKVGLIGTNQNMIGDKVLETERTTPESIDLQRIFRQMADENVDYVIMEISSHSLSLDRVYGLEFEVGAFTNLTQDHLDFHETMENYAEAKSHLFKMCKIGVVNGDDNYVNAITDGATCKIVKYGINKKNTLDAKNISYSQKGVLFDVETPFGKSQIRLNIPGKFSVYNALASIGICQHLGIGIGDIAKALMITNGVVGRAEVVNIPAAYTVMIDYAHTPDGLENIINTVRGFCKGRVVTVFGCGGDRDKTKRPIMGDIAGKLSDFCVVTSDNPRTENPSAIIEDILEGIKNTAVPYEVVENRRDAIKYAMENAQENDVIILAGKGHETYQILNDGTIEFDERKIVKEIFDEINRG